MKIQYFPVNKDTLLTLSASILASTALISHNQSVQAEETYPHEEFEQTFQAWEEENYSELSSLQEEITTEEVTPELLTSEFTPEISHIEETTLLDELEEVELSIEPFVETYADKGEYTNYNQSTVNSTTLHTVKAGETLYRIGLQYGVSVNQIIEWNSLSNSIIYPGQQLNVSASSVKPTQPEAPSPKTETVESTSTPTQEDTNKTTPVVDSGQYHTVRSGEYLWLIAEKYGVTVNQIRDWNKLNSNMLYSGDRLIVSPIKKQESIPTSKETHSEKQPNETKPVVTEPSTSQTYTVRPGDYLYKIATEYGITIDQLKRWNNLSSNYIYSGNVLKVSAPSVNQPSPNKPEPKQPQTPTTNPTKPASQGQTHTVQSGDYLYKIASKYGITVNQLKEWNKLTSNYIYSGDVLRVTPPSGGANKGPATPTPTPTPVDNKKPEVKIDFQMPSTHTVRSGEYLYSIAQKHGITVDQLKRWNQLSSNVLYSGQVLIVSNPGNSVKPIVNGREIDPSTVLWPDQVTPGAKAHQINVPILSQFDSRWKNSRYGDDVSRTIWENGCAIVSLAMIDSYFKGEIVDPTEVAQWAGLDHYVTGAGTAWSAMPAFAKKQNYQIINHGRNVESALREIQKGNPGIVSVAPGYFINGGHLMVVRGYDASSNSVYVNDPYDNPNRYKTNSNVGHQLRHLKNDTRNIWTFSKVR